eukprot:TRINITY_DN7099_c0_g3_i2.p3 TRINITY_DN7099_c0_g3~~TRINITY_DN7099_c0_g3_i2.p3  ORF type:complete len:111 (+),score=5.29 TRINITY_DN7099_c0_g3_i2:260-592(+)
MTTVPLLFFNGDEPNHQHVEQIALFSCLNLLTPDVRDGVLLLLPSLRKTRCLFFYLLFLFANVPLSLRSCFRPSYAVCSAQKGAGGSFCCPYFFFFFSSLAEGGRQQPAN